MTHDFTCTQCKQDFKHENPSGFGGTGYGIDKDGNKVCYQCIGKSDETEMLDAKPGTRFTMYLTRENVDPGSGMQGLSFNLFASNWPGTLRRKCIANWSRTNWGLERTDVWFKIQGECFWGYHIGHNSQILHVRKIKPF